MMAFNYARAASTATRLLTRFGRTLTLTKLTPGAGPAHDPGPATAVTYEALVAVLPANSELVSAFDDSFKNGELVMSRLRALYIAAEGIDYTPQAGHTISFDGSTWRLLGVTPLSPAGTPVYFYAACERT